MCHCTIERIQVDRELDFRCFYTSLEDQIPACAPDVAYCFGMPALAILSVSWFRSEI